MCSVLTGPMGFSGKRVKGSYVTFTFWQIRVFTHNFQETAKLYSCIPTTFNVFKTTCRFEIMLHIKD